MKITHTDFDDLLIIEPSLFIDSRGLFYESYNKKKLDCFFKKDFVQDNESNSLKGVIRGLHFQMPPFQQSKIVRCISGQILDVVVDLRKNSKTYGDYFSIKLSSDNKKQIYVPIGFAHGFQTLSSNAIVSYKVDNYYNPKSDSGISWNDKCLSINWDTSIEPVLSMKDQDLQSFKNFKSPF